MRYQAEDELRLLLFKEGQEWALKHLHQLAQDEEGWHMHLTYVQWVKCSPTIESDKSTFVLWVCGKVWEVPPDSLGTENGRVRGEIWGYPSVLLFDHMNQALNQNRILHLLSCLIGILSAICSIHLILFITELNDLEIYQADVGNTYLEAFTKEKIYFITGKEFATFRMEGHVLVISQALY